MPTDGEVSENLQEEARSGFGQVNETAAQDDLPEVLSVNSGEEISSSF